MFNWHKTAQDLLARDEWFCMITIEQARGSTPRDVGTIMLVSAGKEYGTIGGGNLEYAAIDAARKCLLDGEQSTQTLNYILGPDVEQCCGGNLELSLRNITSVSDLPSTANLPLTPLYLFGAGHVGTALIRALTPLPFAVRCYDSRREKSSRFVAILEDADILIEQATNDTLFLIMTHDHKLDYELVSAILARTDLAFCGLIGSKTKKARFRSRLKRHGFTQEQLSRLTCPIGLETIQGKEPEIIAASVAAQLLSVTGEKRET